MALEWQGIWEDFYKVLGLKAGCDACAGVATADLVDHAYKTTRAILLKNAATGDNYHKHRVALKLEHLEWAYDVLGNPDFRHNYDNRFRTMILKAKIAAVAAEGKPTEARTKRLKIRFDADDKVENKTAWEREEEFCRDQRAEELGRLFAEQMKIDGGDQVVGPCSSGTRKRPLHIANWYEA